MVLQNGNQMKTASRKAKGRKWQQRIVASLMEVFSRFGWQEGDVESRPMGSAGVDIILSPRARKDYPFSIEAKNWKTFPSWAGLDQAIANSKTGTLGAVVWKKQREDRGMICFDFDDFNYFWEKILIEKELNE